MLVLAGGCAALAAADTRTQLAVSAQVLPVARLEQPGQPAMLAISAADLAQGFVDAPVPLHLMVYSNSRDGFAIDLHSLNPMFNSIIVQGLGPDVIVSGEGGSVVQRWQQPQTRALSLSFRFGLAAGLQPGSYPWPVQMSVRPLASYQLPASR
jgi:hypothetical protein